MRSLEFVLDFVDKVFVLGIEGLRCLFRFSLGVVGYEAV